MVSSAAGRAAPSVNEPTRRAALGSLGSVWDDLYPAEQARILRLLIERIDVAADGISVTLHAAGIRSLVAELTSENVEPDQEGLMDAAD